MVVFTDYHRVTFPQGSETDPDHLQGYPVTADLTTNAVGGRQSDRSVTHMIILILSLMLALT